MDVFIALSKRSCSIFACCLIIRVDSYGKDGYQSLCSSVLYFDSATNADKCFKVLEYIVVLTVSSSSFIWLIQSLPFNTHMAKINLNKLLLPIAYCLAF